MKCVNCNSEIVGNFCAKCGTQVAAQEENPNFKDARKLLIDPTENIKSILGNGFLSRFIATGELGNGFAVLTDKRVYFKGKCFFRKGKGFYSKSEEKTVDLKDVTGTGFVHNKSAWAKVVSIIFLVMAFVTAGELLLGGIVFDLLNEGAIFVTIDPGSIIVGTLFLVGLHFLFKLINNRYNYSVFEISYAGGGIAFDVRWITEQESHDFQQQLVLLKQDEKAKEEEKETVKEIAKEKIEPVKETNLSSIPQQLKEYKELLDIGIITQEEFDNKKKELLSK